MANSAGYESVRKARDGHAAVPRTAERPADARASRPRRPGGLLRPSQVPVPGAAGLVTGSASLDAETAPEPARPNRSNGQGTTATGGASQGTKRKGGAGNQQPAPRKSRRIADKAAEMEDLSTKATLSFDSSYTGVSMQKLGVRKNIMFDQNATLAIPEGQQRPIDGYYEFRQLVRDKYVTAVPPGGADDTANWVQDGPYQPNYDNAEITKDRSFIRFHDVPGFSTDRAIKANEWLSSYDVYFKWRVTATYGNQPVWESPEVHHHADAQYDNGQDPQGVRVNSQPAGSLQRPVDLPDRPAGP